MMTVRFFWGMTPCNIEIFILMRCVASRKTAVIRGIALETSLLTEFPVSALPDKFQDGTPKFEAVHLLHIISIDSILTPNDSKVHIFRYTATLKKTPPS
jgi:hypothetical protein